MRDEDVAEAIKRGLNLVGLDAAPRRKRIYIAGPMTGIPGHNYHAFDWAARHLASGWEVVNPADIDRSAGEAPNDSLAFRYRALSRDIPALVGCHAIAMLPGWEDSDGARLEYDVAKGCGLERYTLLPSEGLRPYVEPPTPSVLVEADGLINGPRQATYSHPSEDYGRTVAMFNAWRGSDPLTTEEAVMFMVFVKLSRERHHHKRDNLVDAAGYVGCLAKVVGEDA